MTSNHFLSKTCSIAVGTFLSINTLSASAGVRQAEQAINYQPNYRVSVTSNSTPCQTSQLSVRRVKGEAGVGNVGVTYAFTNIGSSVCILKGYPGFQLLNAKGKRLEGVNVIRSEGTYFSKEIQPPQQVTLTSGSQALFQIGYQNTENPGHSCLESARVEITPPNADHHFTLREQIKLCDRTLKLTPVRDSALIKP